jgi:hypothetical protein
MPHFVISRKLSIRIRLFLQVLLILMEQRWVAICWRSRRRLRKLCTPGTTRARCPSWLIVDSSTLAVVVLFKKSCLMFVVQATIFFSGREIISHLKSKFQPRMTYDSAGPASALSLSLTSMLSWGVGSSG